MTSVTVRTMMRSLMLGLRGRRWLLGVFGIHPSLEPSASSRSGEGGRLRRRARLLSSAVVILALLGGCAPATTTAPSSAAGLGRIRASAELVVGTAASMPPLNMTTKTGEIIGF